ncbi:hypothetical protein V1477_002813 [Vespula maculifrons]|uniref:Uncharacterized protein n=1 Tax=Vespula maculifrons TaxID=7453 RepID=A0ABD2CUY0_VESMC
MQSPVHHYIAISNNKKECSFYLPFHKNNIQVVLCRPMLRLPRFLPMGFPVGCFLFLFPSLDNKFCGRPLQMELVMPTYKQGVNHPGLSKSCTLDVESGTALTDARAKETKEELVVVRATRCRLTRYHHTQGTWIVCVVTCRVRVGCGRCDVGSDGIGSTDIAAAAVAAAAAAASTASGGAGGAGGGGGGGGGLDIFSGPADVAPRLSNSQGTQGESVTCTSCRRRRHDDDNDDDDDDDDDEEVTFIARKGVKWDSGLVPGVMAAAAYTPQGATSSLLPKLWISAKRALRVRESAEKEETGLELVLPHEELARGSSIR